MLNIKHIQFSRTNTANIKLPASKHRLTDKASDFESEDRGFESLCGRLFINKSCAVFERFFKKNRSKTAQTAHFEARF